MKTNILIIGKIKKKTLEKTKVHFIFKEPVEGKREGGITRGIIRKVAKLPVFYGQITGPVTQRHRGKPKGAKPRKTSFGKCLLNAWHFQCFKCVPSLDLLSNPLQ